MSGHAVEGKIEQHAGVLAELVEFFRHGPFGECALRRCLFEPAEEA
jgi:hypothetical protein